MNAPVDIRNLIEPIDHEQLVAATYEVSKISAQLAVLHIAISAVMNGAPAGDTRSALIDLTDAVKHLKWSAQSVANDLDVMCER
jgi:hypothetical protein